MPYKDKKKANESWRNWFSRNRSDPIVKLKRKARDLAFWEHREIKQCSIQGCTNNGERHHSNYNDPTNIIWLCKEHHWSEHTQLLLCSVNGCGRKRNAKGLCPKHYKELRRSNGIAHNKA